MKLGTYGDWLAAIYSDQILLQRSTYDGSGNFPDNASLEIYSSQDRGTEYIELEVLSKAVDLAQGESISNTVQWHLLDRPENSNDGQLARYLATVPEPDGAMIFGLASVWIAIIRPKKRSVFETKGVVRWRN